MSSKEGQPKKVRVACHRCRLRRIKCDGQLPACGNCSKAKVSCIDVDGRNAETLIPRNFASSAKARITWLEDVIRQHLPSFDLSSGPKIDISHVETLSVYAEQSPDWARFDKTDVPDPPASTGGGFTFDTPQIHSALKRSYSFAAEPEKERHFSDEVRSVAVDLGMLSLNTDSRQTHYLGSSSGLLFTRLIRADDDFSTGTTHSVQSGHQTSREHPSSTSEKRSRFATQTRTMNQTCLALYDRLRNNLPAKEDARFLVEIYLRQIHPEHPVLHPKSLMSALEALYGCAESQHDSKVRESGWPEEMKPFAYNGETESAASKNGTSINVYTAAFHVFMVFNLAATIRTRGRDFEFAPAQFYRTAMSVSRECFSETSLPSLQGVLLLTIHTLLAPAEMNIWTLVHICMAHCIDIGLHREPKSRDETPAARNMRRFVFYSIYSLDRSIATIQGRPLGIRDETFDVQSPAAEDQDIDDDEPEAGAGIYSGTQPYSLHRFRLDRIISEIKLLFYHLPTQKSSVSWPKNVVQYQKRIYTELEHWYSQIPQVADAMVLADETDRMRWYVKLELQYFAAVVLLFQPSQVIGKPSDEALLLCFQGAVRQIYGHNTLHESNALYPSWRVVQSVFGCGATIIYCFWTSKLVRSSPAAAELPKVLRMCSNLLSIGGEWWPSAKKGKASFEKVVDLTLRKLSDQKPRNLSQYSKQSPYQWGTPTGQGQPHNLLTQNTTDPGFEGTSDADTGSVPYHFLAVTAAHPHGELYGDFGNGMFDFSIYPEQAHTNMPQPTGLEFHRGANNEIQATEQSTESIQTSSAMTDQSQNFGGRTPISIDPDIQDFFADFWTSNPNWNGSDAHEPLFFNFNHLW